MALQKKRDLIYKKIILLSLMIKVELPFTIRGNPVQWCLTLLLESIIPFYGESQVSNGSRGELSNRQLIMMTLIINCFNVVTLGICRNSRTN